MSDYFKYLFRVSVCNPVLCQRVSEGAGGSGVCVYRVLRLYIASSGILFHAVSVDLQGLSENIIIFLMGMAAAFGLAWLLVKVFHRDIIYSMLLSLTIGFFLTAAISAATIKSYFKRNSRQYRKVLHYFKIYWHLIATNLLYTLGLYIHNFIFWTTDLKMTVAHTFVYAPAYDMATCLAMFTNLSSTIIFISRVEMHFHERYKAYSEAVIGGRWEDINNAKNRMFRQLASELMNLVRIQFIVSVVLYLLCVIFLPGMGFSGLVMQIYPCLAAGYFILFCCMRN